MSLSAQTALISLKIVANIPTHSPKIEIKKIDKNLGITLLFFHH
jgi:predicted transcriptional regulator